MGGRGRPKKADQAKAKQVEGTKDVSVTKTVDRVVEDLQGMGFSPDDLELGEEVNVVVKATNSNPSPILKQKEVVIANQEEASVGVFLPPVVKATGSEAVEASSSKTGFEQLEAEKVKEVKSWSEIGVYPS